MGFEGPGVIHTKLTTINDLKKKDHLDVHCDSRILTCPLQASRALEASSVDSNVTNPKPVAG